MLALSLRALVYQPPSQRTGAPRPPEVFFSAPAAALVRAPASRGKTLAREDADQGAPPPLSMYKVFRGSAPECSPAETP